MTVESAPTKDGRLWTLIVLGSLTMFSAMSTDMYLPSFPAAAQALGVHTVDMQLTLTSFLLGMGLGQVIYGPLSDRFGRKRPLIFGILLFIVASLVCANVTTLPALIAWRFVQAIGGSAGTVISRAMVRDRFTGLELARTMTAMGMVFAFAPAIAPSIGALIMNLGEWPWIFMALAAFGVYTLIGTVTLHESHAPEHRTDHGFVKAAVTYVEILRNREFRLAVATMCAASMALFSFISSSPAVLMGGYGVARSTFGLLFGLNSLAMVVASQVNMRLLPRLGIQAMLRRATAVQVAASFLLLVLILVKAPLPAVLIALAMATGIVSILFGNSMTLALIPFGHRAGSATALSGLLQMATGGVVAALLSSIPGKPSVVMAGSILLAVVTAFILVRRHAPGADAGGH